MPQTLAELLQTELKVSTLPYFNRELTSVGTTAARLLRQSPQRVAFVVVNLSANTLYAGPFPDVSSSKGIRLPASGGNLVVVWDEDFHLVGMEWFVVADAAASALLTLELQLMPEPKG